MLRFKFHGGGVQGLGKDDFFDDMNAPDGWNSGPKTSDVTSGWSTGPKPSSSGSSGFFPQPQTGGFMMPGQMMPGGGMMPGGMMPGMMTPGLMPGMPGYIAPTPWYSGATGLVLLGAAALVAYKVFFSD